MMTAPRPRSLTLPLALAALLASSCDAPIQLQTELPPASDTADRADDAPDAADADAPEASDGDTGAPDDDDDDGPEPRCDEQPGACTAAGRSCRDDTLVDCGPSTSACLVETLFDCTFDGGHCVEEAGSARCAGGDPCLGRANPCDAPARSCDADEVLTVCAPDALGCLVETTTRCALDGHTCLADAEPVVCSGGERCANLPNSCARAERRCEEDRLVECATDASGCLVETTTDCSSMERMCLDGVGTLPSCAEPCHDELCLGRSAGERFCAPGGVTTCRDADGDRCLEAVELEACAPPGCALGVAGVPGCPTACAGALGRIDCTSARVEADTAAGSQHFAGGGCVEAGYEGTEAVFEFRSDAAVTVEVSASWSEALDLDLMAYRSQAAVCDDTLECAAHSAAIGVGVAERIVFDAEAGESVLVVVDLFTDEGQSGTTPLELGVRCTAPICGDGRVGPGEGCDDGDVQGGDGCGADCVAEAGFECQGEPSFCTSASGSCADPIVLEAVSRGYGFSTLGAGSTISGYGGACGALAAEGADRVFAVTLAPGSTVSATVSALGGWDPVVAWVSSCAEAQSSCVSGANATGAGGSEVVVYDPGAIGAPITVYLVVDGAGAADEGELTLELAVQP